MLDEEELLHKMVGAAEEAFTLCLERCGKENAMEFAISSDETAITFSPRVATQSGMEDFREFGTDEEFLFNPDNWDVQVNTDALDAIHDSIHELYEVRQDDDNDDNWREEYSNRVYQLAVRTLEKLKRNLFFSGNCYLNDLVSASEVPYTKTISWSKRLNDHDTHMCFVKWLDSSAPS